jgi:hypothetical protein
MTQNFAKIFIEILNKLEKPINEFSIVIDTFEKSLNGEIFEFSENFKSVLVKLIPVLTNALKNNET